MSLDFLLKAVDRDSFEAMATEQGFLDEDGNPVLGVDLDPTPGSPAYEAGIPVAPPEEMQGEWVPGWHFNLRVSGDLEAAQIEGIEQENKGELLPLRSRTKFGLAMTELGTEWVGPNGVTTGLTYAGVTFIDVESIATPQRVWQ
jgi:hypothetical protein